MSTAATQQQLATGTHLGAPTGIYDYSDNAYLKSDITKWPSCLDPSTASTADMSAGRVINLETTAVTSVPSLSTSVPTPITPLTDISQGSTNMCSAFAFAQAYTIKYAIDKKTIPPQLSPNYAYYFQRIEECTTTGVCPCLTCPISKCASQCDPPCVDCGSYLLSALSIFTVGVCASASWPLTQSINDTPSDAARAAASHRISTAICIPVDSAFPSSVIAYLQQLSPVIVFLNISKQSMAWMQGLVNATLSSSNPNLTDVAVQFPFKSTDAITAGHVVVIVGYDPTANVFIVRNSFGFQWGAQGRFTIRYSDMIGQFIQQATAITVIN